MIIVHSMHQVNVSDENSHSHALSKRPRLSELPRHHSSRHDSTRGTMARARAIPSASTALHPHHKPTSKLQTHSGTSLDSHMHRSRLGAQRSARQCSTTGQQPNERARGHNRRAGREHTDRMRLGSANAKGIAAKSSEKPRQDHARARWRPSAIRKGCHIV